MEEEDERECRRRRDAERLLGAKTRTTMCFWRGQEGRRRADMHGLIGLFSEIRDTWSSDDEEMKRSDFILLLQNHKDSKRRLVNKSQSPSCFFWLRNRESIIGLACAVGFDCYLTSDLRDVGGWFELGHVMKFSKAYLCGQEIRGVFICELVMRWRTWWVSRRIVYEGKDFFSEEKVDQSCKCNVSQRFGKCETLSVDQNWPSSLARYFPKTSNNLLGRIEVRIRSFCIQEYSRKHPFIAHNSCSLTSETCLVSPWHTFRECQTQWLTSVWTFQLVIGSSYLLEKHCSIRLAESQTSILASSSSSSSCEAISINDDRWGSRLG